MMALSMDDSSIFLRSSVSVFLGLVLKDDLRLEQVGAGGDDHIALLEARLDHHAVARLAPHRNWPKREGMMVGCACCARFLRHEDAAFALDLDHPAVRHGED